MRYEVQEGPSIDYRLLTGRMKGQAFVTFPGSLFRGTNVTPFPILWNYFTHPCQLRLITRCMSPGEYPIIYSFLLSECICIMRLKIISIHVSNKILPIHVRFRKTESLDHIHIPVETRNALCLSSPVALPSSVKPSDIFY